MNDPVAIYDVSPYLYTGMSVGTPYNVYGFPMAGARHFIKHLMSNYLKGMHVVAMFDFPGGGSKGGNSYKGNRTFNAAVHSQADWLYDELRKADVACYRMRGYEADELIYSAVEQLRPITRAIKVYTADYDLAHNVNNNVDFVAANSNVNSLTSTTFEFGINDSVRIMYNSILAYKVLVQDVSDNIKMFRTETKVSGMALYEGFCQFVRENFDSPYHHVAARSRQALEFYLNTVEFLTDRDRLVLSDRVELVFPRKVNIDFVPSKMSRDNMGHLGKLVSVCGEYSTLKLLKAEKYILTEADISEFKRRAGELVSGEYAADRAQRIKQEPVSESSVLNLRSFT